MFDVERLGDGWSRLRVLVVGDCMLDRYLWGRAARLSPEAPVPVVEVLRESAAAGGAANVAAGVAAMGAQAQLLGVTGDDEAGLEMRRALREVGVASDGLVAVPGRPTIQKTRVMASNQQLLRVDQEDLSPLPPQIEAELLQRAAELLPSVDALLLSDYRKGVLTGSLPPQLIGLARKAGVPIVTDSKARCYSPFHGSLITPNRMEAEAATGLLLQDDAALEEAGRLLCGQTGAPVLITLGADGMAWFGDEEGMLRIPAIGSSVYDVTGAGDTVVGTLALALAAGWPAETAVLLANYAAAVVVRMAGTAVCTPEQLQAMVEESRDVWDLFVTARGRRGR